MAYYPSYTNPYMTIYPNAYMVNPMTHQFNNPSYTQAIPNPQPQTSPALQVNQPGVFNWVKSEKEVEEQYVYPNGVMTFWNENEPIVYMKQADATGKSTIRTFDLVERTDKPEAETKSPEYATKEDVNVFSDAIADLRKEIETMKGDVYGIAGKKRVMKKAEGEIDE